MTLFFFLSGSFYLLSRIFLMIKMKRINNSFFFNQIFKNCVLQNMVVVDFTIEDGRRHVRFGNLKKKKKKREKTVGGGALRYRNDWVEQPPPSASAR